MVDDSCPVCATADLVCAKWTILLVRELSEGANRFCELERGLEGISPRTLSLRLRALEDEGVVARDGQCYALTAKGEALLPIVDSMRDYGRRWLVAEGDCGAGAARARPTLTAA